MLGKRKILSILLESLLQSAFFFFTNDNLTFEPQDKKAANRIKKGEIPNIHPYWKENSFAESILVDIIKDCWTVDPDRRPSIGDLVTRLRDGFMRNRENEGRAISQS